MKLSVIFCTPSPTNLATTPLTGTILSRSSGKSAEEYAFVAWMTVRHRTDPRGVFTDHGKASRVSEDGVTLKTGV